MQSSSRGCKTRHGGRKHTGLGKVMKAVWTDKNFTYTEVKILNACNFIIFKSFSFFPTVHSYHNHILV